MRNIFAYTALSHHYPEYLSVNRADDGTVSITARGPVKPEGETEFPYDMPGDTVTLVLPEAHVQALLDALCADFRRRCA